MSNKLVFVFLLLIFKCLETAYSSSAYAQDKSKIVNLQRLLADKTNPNTSDKEKSEQLTRKLAALKRATSSSIQFTQLEWKKYHCCDDFKALKQASWVDLYQNKEKNEWKIDDSGLAIAQPDNWDIKLDYNQSTNKISQSPPRLEPQGGNSSFPGLQKEGELFQQPIDLEILQESNPDSKVREEIPQKPQDTTLTEEQQRQALKKLIQFIIKGNAKKYPYIINTTDSLSIDPRSYSSKKYNANFNFNAKINEQVLGNRQGFNFSYFPDERQFFWTLDDNTIVIETAGVNVTSNYQGQSRKIERSQRATIGTSFWGVQTAWAFPSNLSKLIGTEEKDLRITTLTVEETRPSGVSNSTPDVVINSSIIPGETTILFDDPNKGDTFSPIGGGSLFNNLDADNSPPIIQGFPTINLQGLLDNGVKLEAGSIVPEENLTKAGIVWGDFFTGQGFQFTPEFTSRPGIKTLREVPGTKYDEVPNNDVLNLLSNPFLTEEQKDFHYLNSLWWNNFGQSRADISTRVVSESIKDWSRYTVNLFKNRTQLNYDAEEPKLTYTNIFANPGLSITSKNFFNSSNKQTTAASIGTLLGSVFYFVDQNNLDQNLDEAKKRYNNLQKLSPLKTKMTRRQRQQINRRLNNELTEGSSTSGLSQVSGSWTFSSQITPKDAQLFQIRSGLHRRNVQFLGVDVGEFGEESPTFISYVRDSELGPLTYTGYNFPVEKTRIEPVDTATSTYVIVTTPDGVSRASKSSTINRPSFTTVPVPNAQQPFDIEFGLMKLAKFRERPIQESSYVGSLFLPAIEGAFIGSKDNFHYSFALGSWYNPYPDSAPGVKDNIANDNPNIQGLSSESSLGIYAKAKLKWIFDDIKLNKKNQLKTRLVHIPYFSANWNSSANRLNVSSAQAGYTLFMQKPKLTLSVSNLLTFTPQMLNAFTPGSSQGEFSLINSASLQTQDGFKASYSVEIGKQTFFDINTSYRIIDVPKFGQLSLGGYYRNFFILSGGLDSRVPDSAYGLVLEYLHPNKSLYFNTKFGTNDSGFEANINTGVRFQF